LIGFMASGKSAVGAELARRLAAPLIDTDAELARRAGKPVARIFRDEGEERFRARESAEVARAARARRAVVAVGGGAVLVPANAARMRRAGKVVWLRATVSRLWARASKDGVSSRPLLTAGGRGRARATMAALLAARKPLYRKTAHFAVSSAGTPRAVAARVARVLLRVPRQKRARRSPVPR
jgi:shikimate kinase